MTTNVSIEIISRETIKPSSPTPHHLQIYRLSLLDQIFPPNYPASILFYESNPNIKSSNIEKSNQLKASLSESLSCFHPFAGRLVENESVHCNDEGVPYIEARVRSKLFEVIHHHNTNNVSEFEKFLPRAMDDFYDNVVLAIQVNFFDCGGLSIGVCISHKLADASSRMMFLNSWAANLCGHNDLLIIHPPIFDSASLFPTRDHTLFSQKEKADEDIITKMFVFNSTTLETLRKRFSDDTDEECPIRATRVEALTAFLMKIYAIAIKKAAKSYSVIHAVNIRGRMEPALSKYHFGNYVAVAQANSSVEELERRGDFVRKMRGAIKGIDGKYVVDNIRDGDKYLDFLEEMGKEGAEGGEVISLTFTSWCRMPVYEVDFGWGKPVRVGLTSFKWKNFVRFLDTKDGNGIEAWISMDEEDMAKLESNQEFLSYSFPNCSQGLIIFNLSIYSS